MQQSSATPENRDVGRGLRKIVACSPSSSQCLLVPTVFGTVSSLHPISFLMIFILVLQIFLCRLSLCRARRDGTRYPYTHVRTRMRIMHMRARYAIAIARGRTGTVAGI